SCSSSLGNFISLVHYSPLLLYLVNSLDLVIT
ncbi:MAG: hypothetical protein ACI80L_000867, partial [Pseudohongiellaceae bacterium]